MKDYEERFVLFLDILGFQKIINDTEDKEVVIKEKVTAIHNAIQVLKSEFAGIQLGSTKRITQFSDSIVLSFKAEKYSIDKLFPGLLRVIMVLIDHSWICRGAISYGYLYHEDDGLFGPALNDAYNTESKAALYPRVIFDRSILDLLHSSSSLNYFPSIDPVVNIDTDDRYYLDYFTGILSGISYREINSVDYFKKLRKIITDGRKHKSPDIRIKYDWMKNKFNEFERSLDARIQEHEIYTNNVAALREYLTPIK